MIINAAWAMPAVFLIALLSMALLTRVVNIPLPAGRMQSIDGLRGFLALSVFLHHSAIWLGFLHSGQWQAPSLTLDKHFGQSSVALFFMITSCLFFTRILEARTRPIDWGQLYLSRAMRILPLQVLVSIAATIIVKLIVLGDMDAMNPAITPVSARRLLITAGVSWTLHYEWLFYFTLPLLALLRGARPSLVALLLAVVMLTIEDWSNINPILGLNFIGGIATAILIRRQNLRMWLAHPAASIVAIFCLALALNINPQSFPAEVIGLLWVTFTIIAAGNSLFGLFTLGVCRQMGEITFGIYLLHGPLLFLVLRFGLGWPVAVSQTPAEHWMLILAITPILIVVATLSFIWLERPCMRAVPQMYKGLSGCLPRMKAMLKKSEA